MSRIPTPAVDTATGATAEVYAQIKKAAGKVPNTYAAIGALNPAALKAMLQADAVLAGGTLAKQDIETIKLAGLKPDTLKQIRKGEATGDARRDALLQFVLTLVKGSGTVSDEDFAAIKKVGYTDAQLVEISLGIAAITFTNVFNRINDTTLDFPAVERV
jgi:alkylhydroperoxidase family enzyme